MPHYSQFIDGDVFRYSEKDEDEREAYTIGKPYANRKYANDLTVSSILELSKRDIFNDLSFTLFGDGDLFEQTTAPLRSFANVTIERRFLSQAEIADVHKGFGVFLTPTRWMLKAYRGTRQCRQASCRSRLM